MSIVKMKRLRLIGMLPDRDRLIGDLTLLGCVQVGEVDTGDPDFSGLVHKEETTLPGLLESQQKISSALSVLRRYSQKKTGMFSGRPEFSRKAFLSDETLSQALRLAGQIDMSVKNLGRLETEESRIKSKIAALSPWICLDVPIETRETRTCLIQLGYLPGRVSLPKLEESLYEAVPDCQISLVGTGPEQHSVLLICHKEQMNAAQEILRVSGFSQADFEGLRGTADSNIKSLEQELASVREEIRVFTEELKSSETHMDSLSLCLDRLALEIEQEQVRLRMVQTGSVFALMGWVTAQQEEQLSTLLNGYVCAYALTDPAPEEIPEVPIKLKNNGLTRPFNMVTEMYSLPTYDGIDPNPLIMPFFSLFFGMMYADFGYGIVLVLLSIFISKKAKPRGTVAHMMGLMKICGIGAAVMGLVTGGFFGNAIPAVCDMLGVTPWSGFSIFTNPLLDPLQDSITILILAFALGAVHIITGMAVKAYMLIRDGHPLDALFDVGSWWLLFAGLVMGALGHGWYVLMAGAAALILTQGREKKGIFGKLIGGLASLYDIISYLGDVLSYTRLMALLLASSIFGTVMNLLGAMPGNIVAFVIIALIGHAFNMLINIVGTYVHAARLQYLEYFGKFYKDGGKPFMPLAIKTKHIDIIEEENIS